MTFATFIQTNLLSFIALAAIILLLLAVEIMLSRRRGKLISVQELVRMINNDNALLVDIRPEKEYKAGHIRDSICVDLKRVKEQVGGLIKLDAQPIVLLCQYGVKSGHAAQSLYEAGVRKLYRLKGGLVSWQSENLPLQKGRH